MIIRKLHIKNKLKSVPVDEERSRGSQVVLQYFVDDCCGAGHVEHYDWGQLPCARIGEVEGEGVVGVRSDVAHVHDYRTGR